jgi:hypothetical protein
MKTIAFGKAGKLLATMLLLVASSSTFSATNCGTRYITQLLAGPRHGAMMRLDAVCGNDTWVCLDPVGEKMSASELQWLHNFVLESYVNNAPIQVSVDGTASACNGHYAVVEDVRTP